ncbi:hypothetical protein ACHAW6_002291 [Cyclotella cf. meneghiniana]
MSWPTWQASMMSLQTTLRGLRSIRISVLPNSQRKEFTNFDKFKFTLKAKTGKEVSVQAYDCGSDSLYVTVSDADGKELFSHFMPDDNDKAHVAVLEANAWQITLMDKEAKDIATIDITIAVLSVAEYLTPLMKEQLS